MIKHILKSILVVFIFQSSFYNLMGQSSFNFELSLVPVNITNLP